MRKVGYPYDNELIKRYLNTVKIDLINKYRYLTEKEIYAAIEEFAYAHYNYVRAHTYNKLKRLTRLVMGLNNSVTN